MKRQYPTFRYYYSGGSGGADGGVEDGQLLIGDSNGVPILARLKEGPGITITNGPGSVIIEATGAGAVTPVTSVVSVTTSSLTDTPLDGMAITPGMGDFLVFFHSDMSNDASTSSTLTVSLYRNGLLIPSTVSEVGAYKDEHKNLNLTSFIGGLGNGESIEMKWRVGSGVGTCYKRTLIVQRVVT